jgi:hypothetical protein
MSNAQRLSPHAPSEYTISYFFGHAHPLGFNFSPARSVLSMSIIHSSIQPQVRQQNANRRGQHSSPKVFPQMSSTYWLPTSLFSTREYSSAVASVSPSTFSIARHFQLFTSSLSITPFTFSLLHAGPLV